MDKFIFTIAEITCGIVGGLTTFIAFYGTMFYLDGTLNTDISKVISWDISALLFLYLVFRLMPAAKKSMLNAERLKLEIKMENEILLNE